MTVLAQPKGCDSSLDQSSGIIKLAILAVGGQGGGVLANWVADLAELGGYVAQVTSVAGVAQRTGSTIYYIEMALKTDRTPIFALSPASGDIDVLIASELMEAGRAVMRGFVTPEKTTLIASSHRILAVSEKQVPGDGRNNSDAVQYEIGQSAKDLICFDMEKLAKDNGSFISASLFGGLARSRALPFEQDLFERVIQASGKGVEASLRAFRAAVNFDASTTEPETEKPVFAAVGPKTLVTQWDQLTQRIASLPDAVRIMAGAGLRKVVDYQDPKYGAEYLDHLQVIVKADDPAQAYSLTETAAKYIANAMCYDDIIRVSDLKTRASRNVRLRKEQGIQATEIVRITEYFHPRTDELISILPARFGKRATNSPVLQRLMGIFAGNGKRLRTDRVGGFLMLYFAGALRPIRRRLLRHQVETLHLETLIETAISFSVDDYDLGVEVLKCQRLIKGYSDTHTRGHSKFHKVINAIEDLCGRSDAADWVRRLREAALADEHGEALDGALLTIQSFTEGSEREQNDQA